MNTDSLIQYYIQKELEKQQNQAFGGDEDSSLSKIKQLTNRVGSYGNGMNEVGSFLENNVNNELAQKFGSNMANIGSKISNGATTVSDALNAPQNYFKGYANRAVGQGLSKVGSSLAGNSGVVGKIGQTLGNVGSSMAGTAAAGSAGTAAGAGTAASAGAGAGAAAGGATAAGAAGTGAAAGGAAAGSAAGGAAAGGAAAGGSAAGGAAAAGPIGWLVALGIMALQGTNRKRAKKGGEALMQQTNDISKDMVQNAVAASQEKRKMLQEQSKYVQDAAQQNLLNGVVTGGAAPAIQDNPIQEYQDYLRGTGVDENIINGIPYGLNGGNKDVADWINQYNAGAGKNSPIAIPQTAEEIAAARANAAGTAAPQTGNVQTTDTVKRGILDKFISGISDLSRGYDENKNTAFNPANLSQKQFANTSTGQSQALTDYQAQLRDKGIDENIINAVAQGKNSGNKDIANWISNNQDALKPVSNTTYTDKSKMARIGEALGTTARLFNKPSVQGLIAGGLSTALTGNPLYGLGMGYKYANQRAMSDIYTDALRANGVNVNPGMFGSVDSKDMSALMMPHYKQQENDLKKVYYDALADYRSRMATNAENKTEIDKKYKETKAVNDTIKANAAQTRANNAGKGKGGTTKTGGTKKPQDHPDWSDDLSGYYEILTNPKYAAKADIARSRFIKKHGVDPMKYVKF